MRKKALVAFLISCLPAVLFLAMLPLSHAAPMALGTFLLVLLLAPRDSLPEIE